MAVFYRGLLPLKLSEILTPLEEHVSDTVNLLINVGNLYVCGKFQENQSPLIPLLNGLFCFSSTQWV